MSQPAVDARRGILRRRPDRGTFEHLRFAPSPALAEFVQHFWMVRWDLRGKPPFEVETLPHPCVQVVFERGRGEVAGVQTRKFTRRLAGSARVFGVKFRPAAFQPVLRAPLTQITDRVISLYTVWGRQSTGLAAAMTAASEPQRCVMAAEQFLARVLPPMPPAIATMRDIVERLATDPGITRVEQLAAIAGIELRTLQRRFKSAVGVSPKWVIQRYRLHEAAEQLARPDAPELGTLALQLGYFDQPHFIRDFKRVVGVAPGEYRASQNTSSNPPVVAQRT